MADKQRILIVHDDQEVHQMVRAAVQADNLEVVSASDASEGLKLVGELRHDVVLTGFPGMAGPCFSQSPDTRVIVLAEESSAETIAAGIRDQVFGWFSRPFRPDAVREAVEHALEDPCCAGEIEVISASPAWLELRLHCRMSTAGRVMQFVKELDKTLPDNEREGVATAFREILMNAVEHGAGNDPTKTMTIRHIRSGSALLYSVADPGKGFSFDDLPHAAVSNPLEGPIDHVERRYQMGLRSGGFGILMTRSLVDEMIYNQAGNEVLLIKYLR
jgi:anti-sigma regulatory factor (Ser/Thr protein kinase)/CheY-like chemotaxis protein